MKDTEEQYKQYKEEFQSYLVSNEITITEVWEKIKSFIVNFDPDIYPINDLSKRRINTLSNSLQLSIRDLYEKIDIEDTSQLEKKIDEHYKAIYKHFKMIFEDNPTNLTSKQSTHGPFGAQDRIDDPRLHKGSQDKDDAFLSEKDRDILRYSFRLRRNVDISYELINHLIEIINSYKKYGNNYSKKTREAQYKLLFDVIKTELARYHKEKCKGWLHYYKNIPLPLLEDEDIDKLLKARPINQICENLSKRIFDESQTIDNEGDLDKFIDYCKNIITPDLDDLILISNQILEKEGISVNF